MTHKGKTVHLSEAYEGNQSNKNPILRRCKKEEHCYHKSNLKILFRKYNLFKKKTFAPDLFQRIVSYSTLMED